jgi:hypothetical protein
MKSCKQITIHLSEEVKDQIRKEADIATYRAMKAVLPYILMVIAPVVGTVCAIIMALFSL